MGSYKRNNRHNHDLYNFSSWSLEKLIANLEDSIHYLADKEANDYRYQYRNFIRQLHELYCRLYSKTPKEQTDSFVISPEVCRQLQETEKKHLNIPEVKQLLLICYQEVKKKASAGKQGSMDIQRISEQASRALSAFLAEAARTQSQTPITLFAGYTEPRAVEPRSEESLSPYYWPHGRITWQLFSEIRPSIEPWGKRIENLNVDIKLLADAMNNRIDTSVIAIIKRIAKFYLDICRISTSINKSHPVSAFFNDDVVIGFLNFCHDFIKDFGVDRILEKIFNDSYPSHRTLITNHIQPLCQYASLIVDELDQHPCLSPSTKSENKENSDRDVIDNVIAQAKWPNTAARDIHTHLSNVAYGDVDAAILAISRIHVLFFAYTTQGFLGAANKRLKPERAISADSQDTLARYFSDNSDLVDVLEKCVHFKNEYVPLDDVRKAVREYLQRFVTAYNKKITKFRK